MSPDYTLSYYIERAIAHAAYEKLEDGSYTAEITACPGVYSFGKTVEECRDELRSVLEGWILLGFQLHHHLPVIDGIDLNMRVELESLEPV